MKPYVFALLLMITWTAAKADDPLDSLDEILNDRDSVREYADCFLRDINCSSEIIAFKGMLPRIISTSCKNCSAKHEKAACQIINALLKEEHRKIWKELQDKYDPEKKYRQNLDDFMKLCKEKHL